ncbi:hypothetical protein Dimus_024790 [Dionaea muscipula]
MGRVKIHKTLEITGRFANDATIMKAGRVRSVEMKPSQRFIHFLVMKNVIPRFGKRDTSSFLDLTYMDHLMARRLVNPPRVMMRHMSYVISMKDHELPYGDWLTLVFEAFGVPLVIKKGEEPKKYDFFEDTFLTMCKPTGEDGIWWIGSGENRRRDDDEATQEEEVEGEEEPVTETPAAPAVPASSSAQQKDQEPTGVDPSGLTGRDAEFLKFQAEFERKRANKFHDELEKAKAENAKLLALLHQAKFKSNP